MFRRILTLGLCLLATGLPMAAADFEIPEVPFETFTLDNGLRVVVHEDHKAPIVAVNVWYHVGSKNEKPGRTGFAHLFEHLMFNGSENFNDDYFKVLERIGATELNGTTWLDRTNYFQNVPTNALDTALWMESDRMGHFQGAISQERLDEQRGVVQNEKRQGDNQPYADWWNKLPELAYPEGHPYSWDTIGSMEDLDAAALEDVKEWFATYYGAANAVVVLAGDIDVETAREKMQKYFGDIPPGPPVARLDSWVAPRTDDRVVRFQDRVPAARVYVQWNIPEWGTAENDYLNLVSDILGTGKTSRLYQRLVYEDQIATDVNAWVWPFEISGNLMISATAQPGGDLQQVVAAINEELDSLLADGFEEAELDRVKTLQYADFVRSLEGIGGFGGKSSLLATSAVYGGDPGAYRTSLERMMGASTEDVLAAARRWLSNGRLQGEVYPYPDYAATGEGVDRTQLPDAGTPVEPSFPTATTTELDNGLKIALIQRDSAPLVQMRLMVNAGSSSDVHALPGTAQLALNLLDEGAGDRTSLEIAEQLDLLGAELATGNSLDNSWVQVSALKANLAESLDLFADVVLNPTFPDDEIERLRQEQLAEIQSEKSTPIQMALRVFPKLLYGEGHAYSLPMTGSGDEESVAAISRDDLVAFHDSWFRPNNATLLVVGDTSLEEIVSVVGQRFGAWEAGVIPTKNLEPVEFPDEERIYLIDRPDSEQSILFAGHVAPPRSAPNDAAIEIMNDVLGGNFTARINMNLREDKGWAYGAFAFLWDAKGQRPFIAYAPVQTDKTAPSMAEIEKELNGILGEIEITEDEIEFAKDSATLTLAGQWETSGDVLGALYEQYAFDLPENYHDTYASTIRDLTAEEIEAAAQEVVKPDKLAWVVVGDRTKIEDEIRALDYGEITILDPDGNPVEGALPEPDPEFDDESEEKP